MRLFRFLRGVYRATEQPYECLMNPGRGDMRISTNLPEWFVPFDERIKGSRLAIAHLRCKLKERDEMIESLRARAVMGGF